MVVDTIFTSERGEENVVLGGYLVYNTCARVYLIYTCALTPNFEYNEKLNNMFGLDSFVGGVMNIGAQKLNFEQQKKLAEQQNQYNIDMWRMQNEYNSPAAQMQRFKEAGLNPNLIYGQGSSGNAQSAPHMVTPAAPDYSEGMSKLGELFNIAGLRSSIAEMHKREEEAQQAAIKTEDEKGKLFAKSAIAYTYDYDEKTGKWVAVPVSDFESSVSRRAPLHLRWKLPIIQNQPSGYYMRKLKEDMYRINKPIHIRAALAAPEIQMRSFHAVPWRMKTSWWLQQIGRGVGSAKDAVGLFY